MSSETNSESWNYDIFWKEAMNQFREEITEQEWVMWFNKLELLGSRENGIRVGVPSSFYRDQIKQRYLQMIEAKLYELSGYRLTIEFDVTKGNAPGSESSTQGTAGKGSNPSSVKTPPPSEKKRHPSLRADYTFTNFVVGENNSFAANAAIAISRNPGTSYNPCLIYGGVGLGKTHLIQSIGNAAYTAFDGVKITYVTAETFTNEFIRAIKEQRTDKFKNKYRTADLLLIDDIHFLQSKDQTQEELFHTFNALYDAKKQMVFTCDRPVSELKQLTDRLRNRFERGLNVDLQPPSFETRFAILKQKVEIREIRIPDAVIELICKNITTNVRDLESALTKLIAYTDLVNKTITLDIAKQLLKDAFSNPKQSNITIDLIQRVVANYFSLSPNELRGKKRLKTIVFPRQLAMYISREMTEFSTTEIGLEFGGKDHTTVMHACQRVESRMKSDPTIESTIQSLIRAIKESGTKS
jgi:chromosomal replication initiator protein